MTAMDRETLQGRLTAHRRLLGLILAELDRDGKRVQLLDTLRDQQVPRDGQEDPGAVPDEAMAFLLAMADEFRKVEEAMRRHQSEAAQPAPAGKREPVPGVGVGTTAATAGTAAIQGGADQGGGVSDPLATR